MKALLLAFATAALCSPGRGQNIELNDVLGPDNSFRDPVVGVSLTYPAGWQVLGGMRWGKDNGENTIRFRPLWPSEATPSLYYQRFSMEHPRPTDFETYFRESARKKEESRRGGGGDYRNRPETFSFTPIGGRPGCSYLATFTVGSRRMAEYFVRIGGQEAYVMFFTQGSAEDVDAVRAEIDRMAATVHVP